MLSSMISLVTILFVMPTNGQNIQLDFYDRETKVCGNQQEKPTKLNIASFKERQEIWEEKCIYKRERGEQEPDVMEKYIFDELKIVGFIDQITDKMVILVPKNEPSITIYAKVGQYFWNGSIIKITDNCVDIEELESNCSKCKTYYRTICKD